MGIGLIFLVFGYVIAYWGEHHFGKRCRYGLFCLMGFGSIFHNLNIDATEPVTFGQGMPSQSWTTLPGCTGNVGVPIPKKPNYGPATPSSPCGTYQGKPIAPAPPVKT